MGFCAQVNSVTLAYPNTDNLGSLGIEYGLTQTRPPARRRWEYSASSSTIYRLPGVASPVTWSPDLLAAVEVGCENLSRVCRLLHIRQLDVPQRPITLRDVQSEIERRRTP
jgi:hypothetical protein